jgi:hypothetical protein
MREDLHKVVVERERHGSTRKSRKWGQRLAFVPDGDYDDQPKFASSARRRQYGYDHKWFSDGFGVSCAATWVGRGIRSSVSCASG